MAQSSTPSSRIIAQPIQVMPQGVSVAHLLPLAVQSMRQKGKTDFDAYKSLFSDSQIKSNGSGTATMQSEIDLGLFDISQGKKQAEAEFKMAFQAGDTAASKLALTRLQEYDMQERNFIALQRHADEYKTKLDEYGKTVGENDVALFNGIGKWDPKRNRFMTEGENLQENTYRSINDIGQGVRTSDDVNLGLDNTINTNLSTLRQNVKESAATVEKEFDKVSSGEGSAYSSTMFIERENQRKEKKEQVLLENYSTFINSLDGDAGKEFDSYLYRSINDNEVIPILDKNFNYVRDEKGKMKVMDLNEAYQEHYKLVQEAEKLQEGSKEQEAKYQEAYAKLGQIKDAYAANMFRKEVNTIEKVSDVVSMVPFDYYKNAPSWEIEIVENAMGYKKGRQMKITTGAFEGSEDDRIAIDLLYSKAFTDSDKKKARRMAENKKFFVKNIGMNLQYSEDEELKKFGKNVYNYIYNEKNPIVQLSRLQELSNDDRLSETQRTSLNLISDDDDKMFIGKLNKLDKINSIYNNPDLSIEEKKVQLEKHINLTPEEQYTLNYFYNVSSNVNPLSQSTNKELQNKRKHIKRGYTVYINGVPNEVEEGVMYVDYEEQSDRTSIPDGDGGFIVDESVFLASGLVNEEQLKKLVAKKPDIVGNKIVLKDANLGYTRYSWFTGDNRSDFAEKNLHFERVEVDDAFKQKYPDFVGDDAYKIKFFIPMSETVTTGADPYIAKKIAENNYKSTMKIAQGAEEDKSKLPLENMNYEPVK